MSNTGNGGYETLMKETSRLVGQLHYDYWKYKIDKCSNIDQY